MATGSMKRQTARQNFRNHQGCLLSAAAISSFRAFAVGRTQVMLYYFQKLMSSGKLPTVPIMVDSPMAIKKQNPRSCSSIGEYDEEARSIYQKQGGTPHRHAQRPLYGNTGRIAGHQ